MHPYLFSSCLSLSVFIKTQRAINATTASKVRKTPTTIRVFNADSLNPSKPAVDVLIVLVVYNIKWAAV